MSSMKRSRPSSTVIVAALALVVALAGTAVAAPEVMTKTVTKKKVNKIAKRQAKKQIAKRALSDRVITRVESVQVPDGDVVGAVATCDPGETMVGGGTTVVDPGLVTRPPRERLTLVASGPAEADFQRIPADGAPLTEWQGILRNEPGADGGPGGPARFNVFAVCGK